MEVCPVRSGFYDILQKQRISYPYQVCIRTVFTEIFSAFERNSGVIWITVYRPDVFPSRPDGLQIMNIVRTWCRVIRTEYWNFPISVDFWEQASCRILIDRASGRCGSDIRTLSMFICRTLRGIRTPSKARPDGSIGTGSIDLIFAQDSSWITSRSLWTVDVWIYEDYNLKTDYPVEMQPLQNVFLF
jgi:hypothetical protein